MRVFVHAGPSECMTFVDALKADPERARGVEFVGVFIPGLNTTDYSALAPDARIASTFGAPVSEPPGKQAQITSVGVIRGASWPRTVETR